MHFACIHKATYKHQDQYDLEEESPSLFLFNGCLRAMQRGGGGGGGTGVRGRQKKQIFAKLPNRQAS